MAKKSKSKSNLTFVKYVVLLVVALGIAGGLVVYMSKESTRTRASVTTVPSFQVGSCTYTYDGQWGSYGSGQGQFNHAYGIVVDSNYNVWVADSENQRIQKFDASGTFIRSIGTGTAGSAPGQFKYPLYLTTLTDTNNNVSVYVSDTENHRIQVFDDAGNFVRMWDTKVSIPGTSEPVFLDPHAIAADSKNQYILVNLPETRIHKYTSSGTLISTVQTSVGISNGITIGDNTTATPVFYTSFSELPGNETYDTIDKYDSNGNYITSWGGSIGSGDGKFNSPAGIAVDSTTGDYSVFVADSGNNRIQVFTPQGQYITKFGTLGSNNGEFISPQGIAITTVNGLTPGVATRYMYVVDGGNNRVQRFKCYLGNDTVTIPPIGMTIAPSSVPTPTRVVTPGPTAFNCFAAPRPPVITSPINIVLAGSKPISWNKVVGATYYQVLVEDLSKKPTPGQLGSPYVLNQTFKDSNITSTIFNFVAGKKYRITVVVGTSCGTNKTISTITTI